MFGLFKKRNRQKSSEELCGRKMLTGEEFEKRAKKFVEAGYMKELYTNNFLAIYNFGDTVYLACPFFTDRYGDCFGMMFPPDLIADIVKDNLILVDLYVYHCKDGTINRRVITLNDKSFNVCEEGIKYLRNLYKDSVVDYEFDKKLIEYHNEEKR